MPPDIVLADKWLSIADTVGKTNRTCFFHADHLMALTHALAAGAGEASVGSTR